jgi:hypothetical protein
VGQLENPHALKRRARRVGHDRITLAQTTGEREQLSGHPS